MDRLTALLRTFSPRARSVRYRPLAAQSGMESSDDRGSVIWLVKQGRGLLQAGSGSDYKLAEGDLLWLPGGAPHRLLNDEEETCCLIECELDFGPVRINPLFSSLPAAIHISAEQDRELELAPMIRLMIREVEQHRCGHEIVVNRLAEVLLVQMLRFLMKQLLVDSGVMGGLSDSRLAKALTGIHERPEQRWTVASLATTAGMSRTAFNQAFHRVVGCPPVEYLTGWRMLLASRRLEHSESSVAAIGEQLGYRSETAFRRAFRRQTGLSPGALRRQGRS